MNAKQELSQWLEVHRNLDSEADRVAFLNDVQEKLRSRQGDELRDGLIALKSCVTELREKTEALAKTATQIQIEPTSEEETALLRSLLKKMNIPFKEVRVA